MDLRKLKTLIDREPFQEGFLAAQWDGAGGSAATMAVEKAAMLLQGQWAPGTMQANTPDQKPVAWGLDWFKFPTTGGAGKATDGFGGGNGIAVGKDAPDEAIDFLKYFSAREQADRLGALNTGILPVTVGSESSVTCEFVRGKLVKWSLFRPPAEAGEPTGGPASSTGS